MDKAKAIEVMKQCRNVEEVYILSQAFEISIAAIKESLVQKPPHNNAMPQCPHCGKPLAITAA